MKKVFILVMLVLIFSNSMPTASSYGPPRMPFIYYGNISIGSNHQPLPNGSILISRIDGIDDDYCCAYNFQIDYSKSDFGYYLQVNADLLDTIEIVEGGNEGDIIYTEVIVNNISYIADETVVWSAASNLRQDLTVYLNRPPSFNQISDLFFINETESLKLVLLANDPDGDSLLYSITDLPDGAVFSNGTFFWSPKVGQAGRYSSTFIVSDGMLSNEHAVEIIVESIYSPSSISIFSTPLGAKIYLDGNYTGQVTPSVLTSILLGSHTVHVVKDGFSSKPQFQIVELSTINNIKTVVFTLEPIDESGSILVYSSPSGAKIQLDLDDTGKMTPYELDNIATGSHVVSVNKDGFVSSPQFQNVIIDNSEAVSVTFTLNPIEDLGSISVFSNPPDSKIFIDWFDLGQITPFNITNVTTGKHIVSVSKDGYESSPKYQHVNISHGENLIVTFKLVPIRKNDSINTSSIDDVNSTNLSASTLNSSVLQEPKPMHLYDKKIILIVEIFFLIIVLIVMAYIIRKYQTVVLNEFVASATIAAFGAFIISELLNIYPTEFNAPIIVVFAMLSFTIYLLFAKK